MSTEAPTQVQMLNVQVDGEWHQFPKGTRVIEACKEVGKFIPHYCYHPKLSSPGNCRMCMVEMGMPPRPDKEGNVPKGADGRPVISWIPRPQISCAQDVSEGMGIRTDSPMVQECRQGVMEFLLINHPLDCPICDQAGECRLQEFSVEYGNAGSRFLEHKVKKPKNVEIGPRITLDDERCILCSRCVRFMKEVAHDDVLGFVDRGSYSTLTCHPDRELDSNYSLNTVDICPVGALTSNDFRFKMRVWFLKETKSFCTSCATGCNTTVGSRENTVYRQTPRENNEVNENWMCDFGRLNFHYLHSEKRLLAPSAKNLPEDVPATWNTVMAKAASDLKALKGSEIAIIASGRLTNEEMFLAGRLASALSVTLTEIIPHLGAGDDILLSADRNPNTTGAKILNLTEEPGARLGEIKAGVASGKIKGLIVLHEDATHVGLSAEELEKLSALVVIGMLPSETSKAATAILPGCGFAEKRGSMINKTGRLQRLNAAIQPPGDCRDDWEILRDLIQAVGGSNGLYLIEDVFKQMATSTPSFAGFSLSRIGDLGVQLDLPT